MPLEAHVGLGRRLSPGERTRGKAAGRGAVTQPGRSAMKGQHCTQQLLSSFSAFVQHPALMNAECCVKAGLSLGHEGGGEGANGREREQGAR